MEPRTVLLIGVPVILALAVGLIVATSVGRARSSAGPLSRETRRADRPALPPARSAAGGMITSGSAADVETVGVSRRQFFNRGILAFEGLTLGAFGAAVVGFLWPSLTGGFGGKVNAGALRDILGQVTDKKQPFYVPGARAYINPFPSFALPKAEKAYPAPIFAGMKNFGIVALFQKCPHLGCRVPWCQTSQWFECPCHGSKYNRVGEKKGGPAPRGMDRFPVDVTPAGVVINTGIVVQGPPIGTDTTGQEAEGPHCV